MIFRFACSHCQAHIDAYLDNQLSPRARRRINRHLDECADCYAFYAQCRDLRGELQRSLPLVGHTTRQQPDFALMWTAIHAELPPAPSTLDRERQGYRYGLVAVMFMLMLLLPFTMGHRDIPMIMPSPPAPDSQENSTPARTQPVAIATVSASVTESHIKPATLLPTVPEPDFSRGSNDSDD